MMRRWGSDVCVSSYRYYIALRAVLLIFSLSLTPLLECVSQNVNNMHQVMLTVDIAALWNRAGHCIFILWFLLSAFFACFFFPRLFSAVAD